jgi:invasion protein IalB
MTDKLVSAAARPLRWSLITGVAAALLTSVATLALAQQPVKPTGQPAPPPPAAGGQEQLLYSPWLKQCSKGQEANAKNVCITGKASFAESGLPLASAVLIEPDGEKKVLRVTVPEPVALAPGARMVIDQDQPIPSPFFTCYHGGCLTEIDATPELIARMKTGQTLFVQAVALTNQVVALPLPLAEFKKANEGPPADPKVVADQQKKLQDELQRRAQIAQQQQAQQPAR